MTVLADRMKELEDQFGLTVGEIAKLCGVTSSAVSQWFGTKGKASNEIGSVRAAVMLERRTGWSALWIAYGEGPKIVMPTGKVASGPLCMPEVIAGLGAAIQGIEEPKARQAATGMLRDYIDDPEANADMIPLIARRLAGEIPAFEQARRTGTN